MNEFEQFIASKYGIQPGAPVDEDTLRKASAEFLQAKSAPAADLSGLTGKPKNVLEDLPVPTAAPQVNMESPDNTRTRLGLTNDAGMGSQSVFMEPTLVDENPIVSFAAATPDQPAARPQAQPEPQQQKAGRDWGSFHEIMPYRQSDLKLMAPEMETKNFNRDARAQAAQLRNRWNAEFEGDRQFFAGYGIYDLETADEVTRAPAELRMKAAQIIEQKLERGEVPDWVTTINALREGGTTDSGDGSTETSTGTKKKTDSVDVKKIMEENDLLSGRIASGTSENPDLDARKIEENNTLIYGNVDPYQRVNNLSNMISQVQGYMESGDLSSGVFVDPLTKQPILDNDQARQSINNLTEQRRKRIMELRQKGPEAWGKIPSFNNFPYDNTKQEDVEKAKSKLTLLGLTNMAPEKYAEMRRMQEWNVYKRSLPAGSLVVDVTEGGVPILNEIGGFDPKAGITTEYTQGANAIKADRNAQQLKQLKAEKAKLEESRKNIPRLTGGSGLSRVSSLGPGSFIPPRERTDEEMDDIAVNMEVRKRDLERRIAILEQGGSLED